MSIQKLQHIKPLPLAAAAIFAVLCCTSLSILGHAQAAQFTQAFLRLDRLKAVTTTGGRVCVKPSTAGNSTTGGGVETSIIVTFPTTAVTDYVVNATAANYTTNTTGLDTGQTALPITGNVASNVTGKAVTFTVTSDLTAGTLYCFNFAATNTLTTSSAGASETSQGTITTKNSSANVIDTTTYSESIISDDTVVVNAVVPPSFTFALNGNIDNFTTNLSTGSITSTATGRTITLTTNAATGWIVWAKDANTNGTAGAMNSLTASNYKLGGSAAPGAVSRTVSTTGGHPEDYGLAVTLGTDAAGGGTVTLDPNYYDVTGGAAGTKVGSLDSTQYRPIASANGTANGDIINMFERAIATGSTPAANDYTDSITYVGAGSF